MKKKKSDKTDSELVYYLLSFSSHVLQFLREFIKVFDIFSCVFSCTIYFAGQNYITFFYKGSDKSKIYIVLLKKKLMMTDFDHTVGVEVSLVK